MTKFFFEQKGHIFVRMTLAFMKKTRNQLFKERRLDYIHYTKLIDSNKKVLSRRAIGTGGRGVKGQSPPQITADQVTLSQSARGTDYAYQITRIFRPSDGPFEEEVFLPLLSNK